MKNSIKILLLGSVLIGSHTSLAAQGALTALEATDRSSGGTPALRRVQDDMQTPAQTASPTLAGFFSAAANAMGWSSADDSSSDDGSEAGRSSAATRLDFSGVAGPDSEEIAAVRLQAGVRSFITRARAAAAPTPVDPIDGATAEERARLEKQAAAMGVPLKKGVLRVLRENAHRGFAVQGKQVNLFLRK